MNDNALTDANERFRYAQADALVHHGRELATHPGNAERERRIVVAATFTADLLTRPLEFWMATLQIDAVITQAAYAQVLQELLNPQSAFAQNERGFNVVLLRLEDWLRDRREHGIEQNLQHIRGATREFAAAINVLRTRTTAPLLIFFCPQSSNLPPEYAVPLREVQSELTMLLHTVGHVYGLDHDDLLRLYTVSGHEDPRADRIGHLPYTDEYFAAVATLLARRIAALVKPRCKVIALDCDNTLWKGICGEDGAEGIELTDAHLQFQRLLVAQHDAGVLLCLCSKNNPDDVEAVFKANPQMPLRTEHLVCSRVNWSAKSTNLCSLSEELGLGLDSFVFVDDSQHECAEVRAHCAAVLTLQLPQRQDEMRHFLDHVWAFDRVDVTAEAKERTAQYKQNRAREQAREGAADLAEFLASLEVKVHIADMQAGQLGRVAELIQRTNQFNLTGVRRSANEIEALWRDDRMQILVVHVQDRFGDYGLVGALFLRRERSCLEVDTFVLSCRVLGRGVEHRIANELGRIAQRSGVASVELKLRPTARNAPARIFLEESFAQFRVPAPAGAHDEPVSAFVVPADYVQDLDNRAAEPSLLAGHEKPSATSAAPPSTTSHEWHHGAYRYSRVGDLLSALRSPEHERDTSAAYAAPRTDTQAALAAIWQGLLGVREVGVRDDFFQLGGDSLMAVQVISRVGSVLGLELPLYEFFETPTIEGICEKLAPAAPTEVLLERSEGADQAPLSSSQRRLWFIDQLEGSNAAYHIPVALRLSGELNREALQRALDTLVKRHEALRTVFLQIAAEPVQQVIPDGAFRLELLDLRTPSSHEQDARVLEHARDELAAPFDLRVGPLFRGKLLQLSRQEHVLLMTMHHVISDGWSIGVLTRELGELYCAYRNGERDPLPPLPVQFCDFARWQQRWLAQPQLQKQVQYWQEHLRCAPDLLELPADHPRPAVQSYRGSTVRVAFGTKLTTQLKDFARERNLTLAMMLYAAWSVVLARLSGQQDIVIGMAVANRRRTELEGLIGFFVNTLAVRVRMDDDPALANLLQRVKEVMIGAYANQDVPFEKVVEVLQPPRSLSHSPIFQVMFVLQNAPRSALQLPGLTLMEQDVPVQAAQFDLSLSLQESAQQICGQISYASDLFDAATVERWAGYLEAVLCAMIEQSHLQISRLPLLSEPELRQVTHSFNATRAPWPKGKLIHELFEEQVLCAPEAVAILDEDQCLTYAQLNGKANRLAHYLRLLGVQAGDHVPVLMSRSVQMVVAELAVLKAGATYVPMDPSMPAERKAFMIRDCGASLVIVNGGVAADLADMGMRWVDCAAAATAIASSDGGNLKLGMQSDAAAYVMYTSGSTGVPKGVIVEHRNVVSFTINDRHACIERDDCLAHYSNPAFDASTLEVWGALLHGARLVVVPQAAVLDAQRFASVLDRHDVTALYMSVGLFNQYTDALARVFTKLRYLMVGGDSLDPRAIRCVLQNSAPRHLLNVYGPTECTTFVTAHFIESVDMDAKSIPIGRPISNTRIHILDRHGQAAPIGVPGEMYVAGAGVARGYLNRPELTAERFVPDPFSDEPQGRMYKTGDLACWRADGTVEFLGRNDQQVKIRGFRVELGEIEAQLTKHAQVKEAVVIARQDGADEKRLVGYVVGAGAAAGPSAEELRAHLKETLPEYMVPSAFVVLERMPLTPNGKLDRRALPVPELGAYASRQYEAPQGEVEEILAGIWQGLLGLERVGRRDNFFELGGHSLMIVQMMERLRRVGLSAEVRRVFESPTLMDLASVLTNETVVQLEVPPNLIPPQCEQITPQMLPLVELEGEHIERIVESVPGGAANVQDIYPLAPLQEGILFHHLYNEQGDTYVLPTLLCVSSRERLNELVAALQAVIDRHDILRTAVLWEQLPRPVQVVYRRATLPVTELTLDPHRDPIEQIHEWLKPEQQHLSLRRAPLMHLQVAADPHGEHWYTLLQIHHMTVDHVTWEALTSEIAAHLQGQPPASSFVLPYRNHVAQALAYARTHDAETFFRSKLQDVAESTAPFGLLDVHADGSCVEQAEEHLELQLARQMRLVARRYGVSTATLFHAAAALVIAHTAGRDDVVFGSVLLGRLQGSAGALRVLGMFINTLPLRLNLTGVCARELVEQTQRELVDLLGHEQASLAVAQRCSGIVGSAPLFSVLLNYRHTVPNSAALWATADGIRVISCLERTNYPTTLSVDDLGDGFKLTAKTDHRIDPRRAIAYLRVACKALTEALLHDPDVRATTLSILPASERREVLELFNETKTRFPQEKLLHELFERQVDLASDAIAVVCNSKSLTFGELNGKANQLARCLRDLGVGPDRVVGLCVERSLDMVIGLLGILKAGGAYLPLDPDTPSERLQQVVRDAAPAVVLTHSGLCTKFDGLPPALLAIDADWSQISRRSSANLDSAASSLRPHHLAYVIYTSGSTGMPKGVMVEHRNVVSLWQGLEHIYRRNPSERVGVNASFNFDASVKQFIQLLSGRTVVLVPQEARWDASLLLRFIDEHRVDAIDCTPWQLRAWLDAGLLERHGHPLRVVLVGGEPIDEHLWRVLARSTETEFYNVYGPTENTVDTTFARVKDDLSAPHVGRPMENRCVYILDRHGQAAPIGVPGEMYVAGAGVARGYLNRPELTAERFVPDPFSDEPQGRMYKTGDLACWRADGTVEFLGRNDQQVKIRGFRVELGEIEAQLTKHAQVKEAVVIARQDGADEKRLVGYVVGAGAAAGPSAEELRAHLKETLPEYMVPSAFVVLERMPLTPNGKLDRRALPVPELGAYASRQYEAPQGEVEEILAGIWQGLLGLERVGRRDNFFELGGHSLMIVQMMERLRRVGLSAEVRRVFESPTLMDLASVLTNETVVQLEVPPNLIPPQCEQITPQMLPLVELEGEHIERIVESVPGGAANVQDIYPLAPLQEGILFHHMLKEHGGDTYVAQLALSVSSRERLNELVAALQAVIDRHDILRTAVLWEQLPRPVQVVYRRATLPVTELTLDPHRDPIEQIHEWLKPEQQHLSLRRAPLMHLQVAADPGSERQYAVLRFHHITSDHVTLEIVISEITTHLQGGAADLPRPVAFRNHVAQALAYARTHDAETFFRSKLAEVDEPTAPFGLLDVRGDGTEIEESAEQLSMDAARRVRTQARRLGVSAATLFHAAWALVVAHTSGRDDIVFGTVLLGRLQGTTGAQRVLGMLINTLPLRLRIAGRSAKQLVEQTQRELVELLGHEQAPLAVAQRCSGIVGAAPLFTALLNYRHTGSSVDDQWASAGGIRMLAAQERTNYPVLVSVDDLGEGFALQAQTDRRLVPQRMTAYLRTALQSLVEALEQRPQVDALSLAVLPSSERSSVLETFNATHSEYDHSKLVHQLFARQVELTPDAIAVIHGERSLSYAQLDGKANQLARYLQDRGLQRGGLVGICLERSPDMVAALLGTLKAGAGYLPLDPNYPSERIAYMLSDAAPRVILTQESLRARLPSNSADVICVDTDCSAIETLSPRKLADRAVDASSELVYVIYTSGSTGRPKATAMPHAAMMNLLTWHGETFQTQRPARVLQFAALSFDVAFQEIFSTLCTGGTLVLLDEWMRRDPSALVEHLNAHHVERLFAPPLVVQSLAEYCTTTGRKPEFLDDVIVAGEQLRITPEMRSLFRNRPRCRLHNHYGPTETHVVTALTLAGLPNEWPMLPAIGRPIANTQIYILDARQQPVPQGAVGEIYIGGANVACGYLHQPELTALRFLPDPFQAEPQARMYRTGDLGRWLVDATVEYLGRNDDQVKIRGFRIELAEIEAQLTLHERVKAAAVIVRDLAGDRRLIAYVVAREQEQLDAADLRSRLQAVLPEHMVPSAFVQMQELPLTPSGKLNRRALPAPDLAAYQSSAYEPPQGAVEEKLAEIWRELLQVERVGRRDNFFELGGHSLHGMRLAVRVEQHLLVSLSVATVFQHPTVEGIARAIASAQERQHTTARMVDGDFEEGVLAPLAEPPPAHAVYPRAESASTLGGAA